MANGARAGLEVADAAFARVLPMARLVMRRYARRFPPAVAEDLEAAGMAGLWCVALKHGALEPDVFAAMAVTRVRGAMLDAARASDWLSRAERRRLGSGYSPTVRLDWLPDALLERVQAGFATASDAEESLGRKRRAELLARALGTLTAREARMVSRVLAGENQAEIGRAIGISAPRVSQIVSAAAGRLRLVVQGD